MGLEPADGDLRAVMQLQGEEDSTDGSSYRRGLQYQFAGDFLVGHAFRDQCAYLALARRQGCERIPQLLLFAACCGSGHAVFENLPGDAWRDHGVSVRHRMNRILDGCSTGVFEQESAGSRIQSTVCVVVLVVRGEDQHVNGGPSG